MLYGTTTAMNTFDEQGTVFSITPLGAETILHAFGTGGGTNPAGPLTVANGKLFGTTLSGGNGGCGGGCGTVFELTP
jgi:hypothetical protein